MKKFRTKEGVFAFVELPEGAEDIHINNERGFIAYSVSPGIYDNIPLPKDCVDYLVIGMAEHFGDSHWRHLVGGGERLDFGDVARFTDYTGDMIPVASATASGLSLLRHLEMNPKTTLILKRRNKK